MAASWNIDRYLQDETYEPSRRSARNPADSAAVSIIPTQILKQVVASLLIPSVLNESRVYLKRNVVK